MVVYFITLLLDGPFTFLLMATIFYFCYPLYFMLYK